jgi:hypothetical protein
MLVWFFLTCAAGLYGKAVDRVHSLESTAKWEDEVRGLKPEEVKAHLLDWARVSDGDMTFGGSLTEYDDLVQQLSGAGLTGKALLYLRDRVLDGGSTLSLPGVSDVPSPVVWEFFYMLKEYPKRTKRWQGTVTEEYIYEPPWGQSHAIRDTLIIFYVAIPILLLLRNLLCTYPKNLDRAKPDNRKKRQSSVVRILGPAVAFAGPVVFLFGSQRDFRVLYEVAVWASFILCVIFNLIIVVEVSEDVSTDLLENSTPGMMKDALRNNWTNTALLAALNFTIVVTYGFPLDSQSEISEFHGFLNIANAMGHGGSDKIKLIFVFSVCLSYTEYVVAMMSATIHLMFTEPLSPEDAAQYFQDNMRSPAEPLMWFLCAAFWHIIATTILFQTAFGDAGWSFVLWMLAGVLWLVKVWRESSVWSPPSKARIVQGGPLAESGVQLVPAS